MTQILAGIDGGSSTTRLVLADSTGRVLARATGGSCNYGLVPHDDLVAMFDRMFASTSHAAGVDVIHSLYVGSAGVASASDFSALEQLFRRVTSVRLERVRVDNDIMVGLAGGVGRTTGIALIAGTGSACFGRHPSGRTWQSSGWEHLVDDRGSAYRIALEGLVAAVRGADGRGPITALTGAFFEALGISSLSEIIARLHHPNPGRRPVDKVFLASLAPKVFACAADGDPAASAVIEQEIAELALMVDVVVRKLAWHESGVPLVLIGSVANQLAVKSALASRLRAASPGVTIVEPMLSPTGGAVLLAAENAGLVTGPEFLENLRRGEASGT